MITPFVIVNRVRDTNLTLGREEDGREDAKARGRQTFLECAAIAKTQTTSGDEFWLVEVVNCTVVADLGPPAGTHSGSSLKLTILMRWVLAVQRCVSCCTPLTNSADWSIGLLLMSRLINFSTLVKLTKIDQFDEN